MDSILKYAGVVALVILAIMILSGLLGGHKGLAGSTSCGSITCLEGGLRLVSDVGGDFESDVAAVFNSTVTMAGALTAPKATIGNLTVGLMNSTTTIAVGTTASVGTSTPSALGDVVISSAGTTTLMLGSSVAAKGTCIQMLSDSGVLTAAYVHSTSWVLVAGSCK